MPWRRGKHSRIHSGATEATNLLVRLIPVRTHTHIDFQSDTEFRRPVHQLRHVPCYCLDLVRLNLEDQFIMYLHDHPRAGLFFLQPGVH